jgi:hypothetical protein
MYGWINNIIEKFVLSLELDGGGHDVWQAIKASANCDIADDRWEFGVAYPDALTFRLLAATSIALDIPETNLLEKLGSHLVIYSR